MKAERGKQISYNITYMWNLENDIDELICSSRDTDIENKCLDTKRGKGDERDMYEIHN